MLYTLLFAAPRASCLVPTRDFFVDMSFLLCGEVGGFEGYHIILSLSKGGMGSSSSTRSSSSGAPHKEDENMTVGMAKKREIVR